MARKPEMGKFLLYKFFARDPGIRRYLPDTARYQRNVLRSYLEKFGAVYVKPQAGSMGRGIMKVWKSNGKYFVQHTTRAVHSFSSFSNLVDKVDQLRQGKAYIVQRAIRVARIQGRPFDVRVMMQRTKPGGYWQHSGMLAKIAGQNSVVTNVALSRGTVMDIESAIRNGCRCNTQKAQAIINEMRVLGMKAAKHFDSYQLYRELGLDVAVETSGRIWLLEQNTGPSHPLFKRLTSKPELYRTIQHRWGQFQRALRQRKK